jgi:hypothetical protein
VPEHPQHRGRPPPPFLRSPLTSPAAPDRLPHREQELGSTGPGEALHRSPGPAPGGSPPPPAHRLVSKFLLLTSNWRFGSPSATRTRASRGSRPSPPMCTCTVPKSAMSRSLMTVCADGSTAPIAWAAGSTCDNSQTSARPVTVRFGAFCTGEDPTRAPQATTTRPG